MMRDAAERLQQFCPEELASQLLREADQLKPPVNLQRVTSLFSNLTVSEDMLEKAGYLFCFPDEMEIVIKIDDPLVRKRYTLAHELGHLVLKTRTPSEISQIALRFEPSIERWCNQFAAALLMPREWVVNDLKRAKIAGFYNAVLSKPKEYQVSTVAFRLRVSETTPVSLFELKEKSGNLKVTRRFYSPQLSRDLVKKTLKGLLARVSQKPALGRYVDCQTQLQSLYVQLRRGEGSEDSKWLAGILPKRSGSQPPPPFH